MQRDFDSELVQDREFRLGGEIFKFRYPYWEEAAELFDAEMQPDENGGFSFRSDTELAIKRIPMFLDSGEEAHKRFKTLVTRKTNPVPRHQIVEVYRWLVQVTSGLPTSPPSESAPGGGTSDTSSEGGAS